MKIALAAVFVASVAFAQQSLPDPTPRPASPPAANPANPEVPTEPAKPVLKATPPTVPDLPPEIPAAPLPLTPRDVADNLSPDDLKLLLDLLKGNYIRPETLSDEALVRAGVQGLLDRLGPGARVYSKRAGGAAKPSPFRYEALTPNAGYARLGALNFENLAAFDKALNDLGPKPPGALVLDLRATPPSEDFELAAEICRRFCPRGRILFSVKRPKANDEEILTSRDDPRWRGLLVVLVDGDTAGSAEVIGAVLRTNLRAYVVGQKTAGEAAQFDELPLGAGRVLRVAIGEVTLPDNSAVFPGGLLPDLVVPVPQETTDAVLAAGANGVLPLVEEKERPRMNEAALVAGTTPEIDALRERQELRAKGTLPKPPLRDVVLQRALDYVQSVTVFEAGQPKGR